MLLPTLLIFITYLCWCFLSSYWTYRNLSKNVSCEVLHPIFRNFLICKGSSEERTSKMLNLLSRNTRRVGVWVAWFFDLCIMNPTDMELIIKSKYIDKGEDYKMFELIAEENIFAIKTSAKYNHKKKIFVPWVQTCRDKSFVTTLDESIAHFVKVLNEKVGREFDAEYDISLSSMSTMLELLTGLRKETLDILLPPITQYSHETMLLISSLITKAWLRPYFIRKVLGLMKPLEKLHNISDIILNRVQMERKNGPRKDKGFVSFLDYLYERKSTNGDEISGEDMNTAFRTMLLAGPHTINSSVCFSLSLLGIHKDVQEKLSNELELIFPKKDDCITYENIQKCEYLDRVLQEIWRLYSPSLLFFRRAKENLVLDDLNIPKSTRLIISLFNLHRNPEVFSDPHNFNPDNFLPEKVQARHRYSYMPFWKGTRACIGQKVATLVVKMYIAKIIRNFKVHSDILEKDFRLSYNIVLRREEGVPLVFEPRNK